MILEVDNIELSFNNKRIFYGIYLRAEKGKATGILGRNGCGKTSFLRIIFGDLNPKYKNIRLDGVYQKHTLFSKNIIAYLPQHQLLPKHIKVLDAISIFKTEWTTFINEFPSFKIHKNSKASVLSHGELRVLETFLVLSSKKDIIILDEPFSFIAPLYIEKIKKLIQIKKKESMILITDHYYNEIIDISDALYYFKDGRCKQIQSKEDLKNEGYLSL